MDLEDYRSLEGDALREPMRALPREALDTQFQQLRGQRAVLIQRLEALFTPDRLERFLAIRPGGLEEIDKALEQADPNNSKERALLTAFRELNRVLSAFMDVYEERVMEDFRYMSKEELETMAANLNKQAAVTRETLKRHPQNHPKAQEAMGMARLVELMKAAIGRELQDRFGVDPEPQNL